MSLSPFYLFAHSLLTSGGVFFSAVTLTLNVCFSVSFFVGFNQLYITEWALENFLHSSPFYFGDLCMRICVTCMFNVPSTRWMEPKIHVPHKGSVSALSSFLTLFHRVPFAFLSLEVIINNESPICMVTCIGSLYTVFKFVKQPLSMCWDAMF